MRKPWLCRLLWHDVEFVTPTHNRHCVHCNECQGCDGREVEALRAEVRARRSGLMDVDHSWCYCCQTRTMLHQNSYYRGSVGWVCNGCGEVLLPVRAFDE